MSLEDAVVKTIEGMAARKVIAGCLLAIAGLSGATLKTVYFDLLPTVAHISTKTDDMTAAIATHDRVTDGSLHDLADIAGKHETRLALAEQKLDLLERRSPTIEREYTPVDPSQRFTPIPVPNPLQSLGNAIQHAINPPHHWRGRRP